MNKRQNIVTSELPNLDIFESISNKINKRRKYIQNSSDEDEDEEQDFSDE